MFKRKTVLINKDIYSMLKDLNSNVRHIIWDLVLEDLFEGKMPQIDENSVNSESVKSAFTLLRYELNKLQKQYENGKKNTQKKSTQKITEFLCPNENIQSNPNKANSFQIEPCARTRAIDNVLYNNINNNNNNINNIYNNHIISNHNQDNIINNSVYKYKDLCDFELTKDNDERIKFYYEILIDKVQGVAELDPITANKFLNLVKDLSELKKPLKIQGYYLAPEIILEKFINLFRFEESEVISRLNSIYSDIENCVSSKKIYNKFSYQVTAFYNYAYAL